MWGCWQHLHFPLDLILYLKKHEMVGLSERLFSNDPEIIENIIKYYYEFVMEHDP